MKYSSVAETLRTRKSSRDSKQRSRACDVLGSLLRLCSIHARWPSLRMISSLETRTSFPLYHFNSRFTTLIRLHTNPFEASVALRQLANQREHRQVHRDHD